jgi:hypothetical protein
MLQRTSNNIPCLIENMASLKPKKKWENIHNKITKRFKYNGV